ncbi:9848_t:CDS:2 [Paraglomus brasilianum]|uniref:9848_t:CDS:1 n=1 Tax=Paraglomus brasilianum TaxID=144538 RepID=A0A9N9C0H0_9GLOM|nr:9848_t:CDS:2 [Paraglomus brasilianum]
MTAREEFFAWLASKAIPRKQRTKLASYEWESLVETDVEGIASVIEDRLMAGVVHGKLQALGAQYQTVQWHTRPKDLFQIPPCLGVSSTSGWFMVVMAHMTGFYALSDSNSSITACISEELWNVLRKLQNFGYVHGDLRKENILVCKKDAKTNIVFTDWDWAGVAGEVCYPISINPAIYQHPTAKALQPILMEHDEFMLKNICLTHNVVDESLDQ